MNITRYIPASILKFLKIYLTGLLIFTLFRLILFLTETARIDDSVRGRDIFHAFVMGLRFDLVVCGYILLLPFFFSAFFSFFKGSPRVINKIIFLFVLILFCLAFAVSAIDIPYFIISFHDFPLLHLSGSTVLLLSLK